jgi:hypothetical protein
MKTKNNILVVAVLVFACMACREEVEIAPLAGTSWRLVGFVDVKTGQLTEVVIAGGAFDEEGRLTDGAPTDCEKLPDICKRSYRLRFETNSIAHGYSVHNGLTITLKKALRSGSTNIPFSEKPNVISTSMRESPTPTRYLDALTGLTSYIFYNNELKLFYNKNQEYLLYKYNEDQEPLPYIPG